MAFSFRAVSLALLLGSTALLSGCSKSTDPAASAPGPTGTVSGTITPVAGVVSVSATPAAGGAATVATIAASGSYAFARLPVGPYTLAYVTAPGYEPVPAQAITVAANAPLALPPIALVRTVPVRLVAARWRLSASLYTETVNGTAVTTDVYATRYPACKRDDFVQFHAGQTGVFDEGATKCQPNDPQTSSLAWELAANDTQLVFTHGFRRTYAIRQLTSTTLVLELSATSATGNPVTALDTYTAF